MACVMAGVWLMHPHMRTSFLGGSQGPYLRWWAVQVAPRFESEGLDNNMYIDQLQIKLFEVALCERRNQQVMETWVWCLEWNVALLMECKALHQADVSVDLGVVSLNSDGNGGNVARGSG